jgi:hypothetical protein
MTRKNTLIRDDLNFDIIVFIFGLLDEKCR